MALPSLCSAKFQPFFLSFSIPAAIYYCQTSFLNFMTHKTTLGIQAMFLSPILNSNPNHFQVPKRNQILCQVLSVKTPVAYQPPNPTTQPAPITQFFITSPTPTASPNYTSFTSFKIKIYGRFTDDLDFT